MTSLLLEVFRVWVAGFIVCAVFFGVAATAMVLGEHRDRDGRQADVPGSITGALVCAVLWPVTLAQIARGVWRRKREE